jgi:hypothetical protein
MEHETHTIKHETWEKAFKMIELENGLSNHRVTTIMMINAFLFIAFLFGIFTITNVKSLPFKDLRLGDLFTTILLAINAIICMVGASSSLSIREGIYAAYLQIIESKKWLEEVSGDKEKLVHRPYPPIVGRKLSQADYESVHNLSSGNLLAPKILAYVWISFLLIDIYFALRLHTT